MIITDEITDFLCGGVSIVLASRNAELLPSIARAAGVRVIREESTKVRILISAARAGELLDHVRQTRTLSATFSRPNTHRALQFKGRDARILDMTQDDWQAVRDYASAFADCIRPLGFPDRFTQAFLATNRDEVAIEFTPCDAFQQTPGPTAGKRLA